MKHPFFLVDAFEHGPFTGNPAGVVMAERQPQGDWMAKVAAEVNQAETAFVWPVSPEEYGLRWFTPTVEVDLCGHATMAAAHALGLPRVRFQTRVSGVLEVVAEHGSYAMDFPAYELRAVETVEAWTAAIGTQPRETWIAGKFWMAVLSSEDEVRSLTPDLGAVRQLGTLGGIVTARGEGDHDFVSRFFAPQAGVDEDPVTGSAHCVLGPYWAGVLGRSVLTGYQASRRGGRVGVEVHGDRVLLRGSARTVVAGEIDA